MEFLISLFMLMWVILKVSYISVVMYWDVVVVSEMVGKKLMKKYLFF